MATTEMIQVNTLLTNSRNIINDVRESRIGLEEKLSDFENRLVKSIPADTKGINIHLYQMKVSDRKVKDNTAYVGHLLSKITLTEEYFQSANNTFLRSASISDSSQPGQANVGATIAFDVYIVNRGMYYSWTSDKAVTLKIQLYSSASVLIQTYEYELNTTTNVPGEEISNGDYGLIKLWAITGMTLPGTPDNGMTMVYSLYDTNGGTTNDYSFNYSATVDLLSV